MMRSLVILHEFDGCYRAGCCRYLVARARWEFPGASRVLGFASSSPPLRNPFLRHTPARQRLWSVAAAAHTCFAIGLAALPRLRSHRRQQASQRCCAICKGPNFACPFRLSGLRHKALMARAGHRRRHCCSQVVTLDERTCLLQARLQDGRRN